MAALIVATGISSGAPWRASWRININWRQQYRAKTRRSSMAYQRVAYDNHRWRHRTRHQQRRGAWRKHRAR